jgi:release factor glutamine methyltransferase
MQGDWSAALAADAFDLVIANPPYVASDDIAGLAPEVRDHEPRLALDGGTDGLDAYRTLAPEILRVLKPGGLFAVEIGADQQAEVTTLFGAAGAEGTQASLDLSGRWRVVSGRKKALGDSAPSG